MQIIKESIYTRVCHRQAQSLKRKKGQFSSGHQSCSLWKLKQGSRACLGLFIAERMVDGVEGGESSPDLAALVGPDNS